MPANTKAQRQWQDIYWCIWGTKKICETSRQRQNLQSNGSNEHNLEVQSSLWTSFWRYLAAHEISRNLSEQIIDPTWFWTWKKLLLTLATVFNSVFRIKNQRPKDQQYITEDVILARNWLIKMSQQNFFFSTTQALKRGSRIDSKRKIRSLNPMLDNKDFGHVEDCNLHQITSKSTNFRLYWTQKTR